MNKEEIEMLKRAIDSHVHLLCRDIEAYKKTENIEAIQDCHSEIRKYKALKEKLT
jgi:hypothetical protein